MKRIALSALVALGLSGIAIAGGDIAPVAPAPSDSWSGFYVGLQAGGIWGEADWDDMDKSPYAHDIELDSWVGGIYAGYNWLLRDNWLIGVEGEWNYVDSDKTVVTVLPDHPNLTGNYKTRVKQKWDAALLLRFGKVFDDTYLPYITGGIAWGDFDTKISVLGVDSYSGGATLTGWTIGAGLEMKLSENVHARIQYRYTDYGDDRYTMHGDHDVHSKLGSNAHMVTVGINYTF